MMRRILQSGALGSATVITILLCGRIFHSAAQTALLPGVALGSTLAWILYQCGVELANGAFAWVILIYIMAAFFYSLVWAAGIGLVQRIRSRHSH
jgi:hypothetical protein